MTEVINKILPFIRDKKLILILSLLCALPIALIKGFQAYYVKEIFEFIFEGQSNIQDLIRKCLILCASQLAMVFLRVFYYGNIRNIIELIACKIREKIFATVTRVSFDEFSKFKPGELISLAIFDTNSFSFSLHYAASLLREPIIALVLLGVAVFNDWQLTLFVLSVIPIIIWILSFTGKQVKKHTRISQDLMGDLTEKMNEIIEGIIPIKLYAAESSYFKKFEIENEKYLQAKKSSIKYEEHSKPSIELVGTCAIIGVILFAYYRIQEGELTTAEFMSFIAALVLFLEPIKKINVANIGLNQAKAAGDRIFALLSKEEISEIPESERMSFNDSIEFRNVCFSHGNFQVLKNINFKILKNEKVAIIGPSGCGKTTLVNLLLGLYEIDRGEILIDGKEIRTFSDSELRSHFSYIDQRSFVLEDSVLENILFGREKPGNLEKLSKKLEVNFLGKEKLNSLIKESGKNFSGGQIQRISILRSMLKEADIYVFDEVTSALDNATEQLVNKAIMDNLKEKTIISIAHRLNSIKDYDRIILLSDGEVVGNDNHESLLLNNEGYKRLFELNIGKV